MSPLAAVTTLAVGGFVALWAMQSLVLAAAGEPLAAPLRFSTRRPLVVYTVKAVVQLVWLGVIVGYPLLIGSSPSAFYADAFALPAPIATMGTLVVACLAGFALINLAGWAVGGIVFERLYSGPRTARKIAGALLTPVPLALFEEAVFRAVVLGALLATFGDSGPAVAAAIVLSSVLFSAAHFVRRHGQVRNTLQPALGLAVVSVVLGIAYHVGDRTLWLPVALHAAGIVGNELPRSFSVYRGPAWLVGYRSFAHCGVFGVAVMSALGVLVYWIG